MKQLKGVYPISGEDLAALPVKEIGWPFTDVATHGPNRSQGLRDGCCVGLIV